MSIFYTTSPAPHCVKLSLFPIPLEFSGIGKSIYSHLAPSHYLQAINLFPPFELSSSEF